MTAARSRAVGRRALAAVLGTALLAAAAATATPAGTATSGPQVEVLVRGLAPAADAAEAAVRRVGGAVTASLPLVGGVAASVPADRVDELRGAPGVVSVERADVPVTFDGAYGQGSGGASAVYPAAARADRAWAAGYRGQGVGVAVIDTGVNPVGDLAGRVSHSVDFTAEGDGVDRYGHGTFVAGMIAGTGATGNGVTGTAPDAHIISLKIAGRNGSADITNVLAALQYAVSFKDVYDIDVINLSLGTESEEDYRVGLLNFAVERAWANGIVVVVSASNRGPDAGTISKPADDPFVITVGASDDRSTPGLGDDSVPAFSAAGPTASNGLAKPDLVAPGRSVVSTRAAGSTVDTENPGARIGAQHFVGSGTSFASGVVSGAAALVLSRSPELTPDQVKARLLDTARTGPVTDRTRVGAGWLDAEAATLSDSTARANEGLYWSEGTGTLDASRGPVTVQVQTGTVVDPLLGPLPLLTLLTGDLTAQNKPFDAEAFRNGEWSGSKWYESQWFGSKWYGSKWYEGEWYGSKWYGSKWYGSKWYGSKWYGSTWG